MIIALIGHTLNVVATPATICYLIGVAECIGFDLIFVAVTAGDYVCLHEWETNTTDTDEAVNNKKHPTAELRRWGLSWNQALTLIPEIFCFSLCLLKMNDHGWPYKL